MKKLKNKIFFTIFTILSVFLITIIGIFNFQYYNMAKTDIEKNLFRMNNDREKNYIKDNIDFVLDDKENIDTKVEKKDTKRFMDEIIYTVLLDYNNQILEIISHTEDGSIDQNVQEIASKIISMKN